ncbi:hypothetical protein [Bradyrhizobium sp. OK095]|uniref:hypothetical protein n=1 Tax=Bradyrhizobium sp. OK095 TaxID=1882760 RepID=UPI0008C014AC|nr:hypothetical protein [Bradyrhizobium sp. OK095]SEN59340.1 hypothetical protein SAMN05443254_109267 [Bradyrhizobium sp. OK095]
MPPRNAEPWNASPPPNLVPVEVEELIFRLYPEASTRHAILKCIHEHVERLQAQGRHSEIPAFITLEIEAMKQEDKERQKGKRRKLLTIVGRAGIAAFVVASHWHW